jgi:hypothetical protein
MESTTSYILLDAADNQTETLWDHWNRRDTDILPLPPVGSTVFVDETISETLGCSISYRVVAIEQVITIGTRVTSVKTRVLLRAS